MVNEIFYFVVIFKIRYIMNKLFFCFIAVVLFGFSTLKSENVEIDLTKSYGLEIWWHPETGVIKSEPRDNWDLAFQIGQKAAIMINSQKGMKLWVVPNSDYDTFLSLIDTTGMGAGWETYNNSVETWDIGAFNCDKDGFEADGDFGWGEYNMATHYILGNKIFILKLADNTYKQVLIESLASSVYTVKWADLNGENETTLEVNKMDYPQRNFVYATIKDATLTNREPDKSTWALVFGKYTGMVATQAGGKAPYSVTGVRTNQGYFSAKLSDVEPYLVPTPELTAENFSSSITTIGDDWKKLNSQDFTYTIVEKVAYFITNSPLGTAEPKVDRIIFKSFAGSSTGKLSFDLNPSLSVNYSYNNTDINVYPEITKRNSTLTFEYNFDLQPQFINVKLIGIDGNEVLSEKFENISSTGKLNVTVPSISAGVYFALVESNYALYSYKIIVE